MLGMHTQHMCAHKEKNNSNTLLDSPTVTGCDRRVISYARLACLSVLRRSQP